MTNSQTDSRDFAPKDTKASFRLLQEQDMAGKCIDPAIDWAFKRLFGEERNKRFLISFLNALLRRRPENAIIDISYDPQEKNASSIDGRSCRLDIICTTLDGEICHIEMQNVHKHYYEDRLLYYSAVNISAQGVKGLWDYHLHPLYTISVCGDAIHKDAREKDRYAYYYALREEDNHDDILTDSLCVILVELGKFDKSASECADLFEKWVFLLKNLSTITPEEVSEMYNEDLLKDFISEAAFEKLSDYDKQSYIRAANEASSQVFQLKYEKEQGLAQGLSQGLAQGLTQGREEKAREIAGTMKAKGMDDALIAEVTGLAAEVVKAL